jgi:formylglycine-generating enzyme required for sulfatase activity
VTWFEAYAYAVSLGGRLPTEIEWERAARGNCTHQLGDRDGPGWCDAKGNAIKVEELADFAVLKPASVGEVCSKQPVAFGLCDLYGNVWEWTSSVWVESWDAFRPPEGPAFGVVRSIRGGGFDVDAWFARPALRVRNNPRSRDGHLGFRVVLPPPPQGLIGDP